jgi:hypothetical protein
MQMGKRAMEEMLLLDHQDRALGGKLAHRLMPLLEAALGKQLWEISNQSPGNVTAAEGAFRGSTRGGFEHCIGDGKVYRLFEMLVACDVLRSAH